MSTRLTVLLVSTVVAASLAGVAFGRGGIEAVQAAPTNVGYQDFSYAAPGVDKPTANKPQSKLWHTPNGIWWGILFNRSAQAYRIYRYDWASHTWRDTGILVDKRNTSKADAIFQGKHLYVATAGPNSASEGDSGRVLRYTYHPATKKYTLDPGFPVKITRGGAEAIVLSRDTRGKFWVTYTKHGKVFVNHSLRGASAAKSWRRPFVLPVKGASNLTADDISSVVSFDSKIGVMWSNQNDDAMYFATHADGARDGVWRTQAAEKKAGIADDHINLKSLQAGPNGRIFAAVKTALNDSPDADPDTPLIRLLVRGVDGIWSRHVFGRVADDHTRPLVLIDREHRKLYMFATAPVGGGTIYYKKTSLTNVSFPKGRGTPFIRSAAHPKNNSATSTKQKLTSRSGLVVLASDESSRFYVHNAIRLGAAG